ncbi:hypothetical protein TNCV_1320871 [Trichonephila clavipes]|nr:hypothetical protein TNCV_1320871 [Trichonephila clavipes]
MYNRSKNYKLDCLPYDRYYQRASSKLPTTQIILPLHQEETLRHVFRISLSQPITIMPLSILKNPLSPSSSSKSIRYGI